MNGLVGVADSGDKVRASGGDRVVFAAADLFARELGAHEVPLLQALFDANPEYFLTIHGRPALPDEAQSEFADRPPTPFNYSRQWCLGVFESDGELAGVCIVVADLCAQGVWHLTLFLLATRLHGLGLAGPLYGALEAWAKAQGARWMRLGVVVGNQRAERFWQRCGFQEVRQRLAVHTGARVNDLRVMVKSLGGASWSEYFELVPRDQPDSSLP